MDDNQLLNLFKKYRTNDKVFRKSLAAIGIKEQVNYLASKKSTKYINNITSKLKKAINKPAIEYDFDEINKLCAAGLACKQKSVTKRIKLALSICQSYSDYIIKKHGYKYIQDFYYESLFGNLLLHSLPVLNNEYEHIAQDKIHYLQYLIESKNKELKDIIFELYKRGTRRWPSSDAPSLITDIDGIQFINKILIKSPINDYRPKDTNNIFLENWKENLDLSLDAYSDISKPPFKKIHKQIKNDLSKLNKIEPYNVWNNMDGGFL